MIVKALVHSFLCTCSNILLHIITLTSVYCLHDGHLFQETRTQVIASTIVLVQISFHFFTEIIPVTVWMYILYRNVTSTVWVQLQSADIRMSVCWTAPCLQHCSLSVCKLEFMPGHYVFGNKAGFNGSRPKYIIARWWCGPNMIRPRSSSSCSWTTPKCSWSWCVDVILLK